LQDLFAETHIIRDEASLVPPAVDYSYSRIDAAMVDGRRPAVYDYDDAQVCMPPLSHPETLNCGRDSWMDAYILIRVMLGSG
jgi:hypothetical protein